MLSRVTLASAELSRRASYRSSCYSSRIKREATRFVVVVVRMRIELRCIRLVGSVACMTKRRSLYHALFVSQISLSRVDAADSAVSVAHCRCRQTRFTVFSQYCYLSYTFRCFVPNTHRRRNATPLSSRVASASAV